MKRLLFIIPFLTAIASFAQSPTSVYWLKSRVDGSVPTPVAGWGSIYFDYVADKWKFCNGTSCYDLPTSSSGGTVTTRNNLPPSVHTSSFTLVPADTSKMHILSGGSGAIVITAGTFSGLSGKGLQFAFRRDRADTVYFATGSETIIQSPGATLGVADSTFAYLYYNGTTDKFYLANGGSGGGGGGGSGTVESVTGPNVDNTDPANPVVNAQTTVTGNAGTATALATARTIGTLTGDGTSAGSSFNGTANNTNALTLATVNSNVGTFGSSTAIPQITLNAKGLATAATTVAPQTASGSQPGFISAADWLAHSRKANQRVNFINAQTGTSYTLAATDTITTTWITMNNASANNVVLPKNSTTPFAIGAWFNLEQTGAGTTSIIPEDGTVTVTYEAGVSAAVKQDGPNGIRKTGTNTWKVYNGTPPLATANLTKTDGSYITTIVTNGTNAVLQAVNVSSDLTGVVPVSLGGTGLSALTANQILYSTATNTAGQSANLTYNGTTFRVGGGTEFGYAAKTTTYTVTYADRFIECTSGTFTVTLPTAVGHSGFTITIDNSGAGTITLATTSSQTIDGAAPGTLTAGTKATLYSNGANWRSF